MKASKICRQTAICWTKEEIRDGETGGASNKVHKSELLKISNFK